MVGAKLEQPLTIFIQLANAKVADAAGPGVMMRTNSGIEVAKQKQMFRCGDLPDPGL